MRSIGIIFTLIILNLAVPAAQAQEETVWQKIERLEKQKEEFIAEEKAALRQKVEKINERRENNEISAEEATALKEAAAREHALNIENRIAIIDNQIALLSRGEEGRIEPEERNGNADEDSRSRELGDRDRNYYNRTTMNLTIAAGFSNALQEGQSLNDSDFKIAGSRFFEIGMDWKFRVFQHSNLLRFRYGFSFQFNGLKPTDNRYFVEDEAITRLEEFPLDLNKSKFRMDNLVVPLHFEIGPSIKRATDREVWYSTEDRFKLGLGGYAGLNISERQKLKYSEGGDDVKEKQKNDFNTNDFIYGLSAYFGWGGTYLYVKYDLNPIFKDPNPELHMLAAGLRWHLN